MLLGFGYLYKFAMFYFFFFQKAENNRLKKKNSWLKFCNVISLFLFKIGSVSPLDQQINLVLSEKVVFKIKVGFTCRHLFLKNDTMKPLIAFIRNLDYCIDR